MNCSENVWDSIHLEWEIYRDQFIYKSIKKNYIAEAGYGSQYLSDIIDGSGLTYFNRGNYISIRLWKFPLTVKILITYY